MQFLMFQSRKIVLNSMLSSRWYSVFDETAIGKIIERGLGWVHWTSVENKSKQGAFERLTLPSGNLETWKIWEKF